MKFQMIVLSLAAAGMLGAAEPAPILHYDFTAPVIRQGGKFQQPAIPPTIKMSNPEQALILTGEKGHVELVVPESKDFSFAEGGTIYALVRFDQTGKKAGQNDSHDMIVFKNKNLLFGRNCGSLYFNLGSKWDWTVLAPNIPLQRWTALAATVTKNAPKNYTVRLYIDGKKAAEKNFRKEMEAPNGNPVGLARGWGGPWFFCGLFGKIMIFDQPLTDRQIAGLTAAEKLLKKE